MRYGIGMRYWLALAFAAITAVTAVGIAQVLAGRTEEAFRQQAAELALGHALSAEDRINKASATSRAELQSLTEDIAERRRIAVFVVGPAFEPITARRSLSVEFDTLPNLLEASERVSGGQRYTRTYGDGRTTLVALPLASLVDQRYLVAYARSPELAAGLGIAREKTTQAAIAAAIVGGLAGLLVAVLITARLRRIAGAAAAIESGDFERALEPRFRDELGTLAQTIDRMRLRLRDSFAIMESERDRLRLLLERLHDGVVTVDADLRVEFANSTARRVLALEGDVLTDPWPAFSLRGLAEKLFDPAAEPVHARVASDTDHAYSIVGIPAGPEVGSVAVLVLTDVSERDRRDRAQREFVANAAHELRTPLSVISGAVEVLQAGAKEVPDERDRFLAHIEREAARLGRLARALLVLARAQTRAETLRLEPIELHPLLEQVAEEARSRVHVPIEVSCPAGLYVAAQPQLAEQIVSNLVDNAAKHTERGRITVRANRARGGVTIEVADTGSGIAPEEREAVFERFYRSGSRDRDGFGLGLAIVREAVRALGGSVDLESAPDRGTTVRVQLPVAERRAA